MHVYNVSVGHLQLARSAAYVAHFAGMLAAVVAWRREGRYLRGRDIRRIPYVGDWLADHVPMWRDGSPRSRAAKAASRRAKASPCSLFLQCFISCLAIFKCQKGGKSLFLHDLVMGALLLCLCAVLYYTMRNQHDLEA
jgi:hypothetical protein